MKGRDELEEKKEKLLKRYLHSGTAVSENVIRAYKNVARENFIPKEQMKNAYHDSPLSIGHNQTISAPHISFIYAEKLEMKEGMKVLEIGGGSGYNAAFFAELVGPKGCKNPGHVYTIERLPELVDFAKDNLEKNGYSEVVTVIHGDGTLGYPDKAPYDKILVTAASPEKVPKPFKNQLRDGGTLCIPAGSKNFGQTLYVVKKKGNEFITERKCGVRFVPLL